MIAIDLRRRHPFDGDVPIAPTARMEWTPLARRTEDGFLVLPAPMDPPVTLTDGVGVCDPPPGTVWKVREPAYGTTRLVLIVTGTERYEDLPTVDPTTLVPVEGGQAVWDAALTAISNAAALVVATGTAALASQLAAAGSATAADASAGSAAGSAGAASGSATTAAAQIPLVTAAGAAQVTLATAQVTTATAQAGIANSQAAAAAMSAIAAAASAASVAYHIGVAGDGVPYLSI